LECQTIRRIDFNWWSLLWVAQRTLLSNVSTHPCGSSCNERLHHRRPDAQRQLPVVLVANRVAPALRFTVTSVSALGLRGVNVNLHGIVPTNAFSKAVLSPVKLWKRSLAPERFAIPIQCFPTTSPDALSFVLRSEPRFWRNNQTPGSAEAAAPTARKQLVPRHAKRILSIL